MANTDHACPSAPTDVRGPEAGCIGFDNVFNLAGGLTGLPGTVGEAADLVRCMMKTWISGADVYAPGVCVPSSAPANSTCKLTLTMLAQALRSYGQGDHSVQMYDKTGYPTDRVTTDTGTVLKGDDWAGGTGGPVQGSGTCLTIELLQGMYDYMLAANSNGGGCDNCTQEVEDQTKGCTVCSTCWSVVVENLEGDTLYCAAGVLAAISHPQDEEDAYAESDPKNPALLVNTCASQLSQQTFIGPGNVAGYVSGNTVFIRYEGEDNKDSRWLTLTTTATTKVGCKQAMYKTPRVILTGEGLAADIMPVRIQFSFGSWLPMSGDLEGARIAGGLAVGSLDMKITDLNKLENVDVAEIFGHANELVLAQQTSGAKQWLNDDGDYNVYIHTTAAEARCMLYITAPNVANEQIIWRGMSVSCRPEGVYMRYESKYCIGPSKLHVEMV